MAEPASDELIAYLKTWDAGERVAALIARIEQETKRADEAEALAGRLNGGEELQLVMRLNNDLVAQLESLRKQEPVVVMDANGETSALGDRIVELLRNLPDTPVGRPVLPLYASPVPVTPPAEPVRDMEAAVTEVMRPFDDIPGRTARWTDVAKATEEASRRLRALLTAAPLMPAAEGSIYITDEMVIAALSASDPDWNDEHSKAKGRSNSRNRMRKILKAAFPAAFAARPDAAKEDGR
jgi:hypothetical protein